MDAKLIIRKDGDAGKHINIHETPPPTRNGGMRIDAPPKQPRSAAPRPSASINPMSNRIPVESFNDFLNPMKKLEERPQEYDDGDEGEMESEQSMQDFGMGDEGDEGGEDGYEGSYDKPSIGFNTIEDEKRDIILKLHRLKSKGYPVSKNFTMQGDIHDMRTELEKVKYGIDVEASIKFQRKILMGIVSTLEFANNRWDPFDLALNGWSESVYDNLSDYDNCFERLWAKYKNKASLPPELELLLTLGGSAFMFHITQSMMKTMPAAAEVVKNNPHLMEQIMTAMTGAGNKAATSTDTSRQTQVPSTERSGGGYEMQGPPLDIGKIAGMFGPMSTPKPPPMSSPPNFPQTSRMSQVAPPKPPPSLQDEALSDVMSDMDSIPESAFSDNIKKVVIDGSAGRRGRGRGRGGATTKNILNLV